jgi:glycosyltransferase involved in cell wall biosynthesis
MITTFYPPYAFGGDAIFVYGLTNMLARRGHEVDVIHCVDSYRALAKEPLLAEYPNEPGVTLHSLVSGVGALSPLATQQSGYPLFKGRKIRAILAAKRFDVIHFHNISLIGGPMILRYGEGIKLYTTHEHWLICPMHTLFKFQREACVRPSCFRCTLVSGRPPQLWRYTGMLQAALRHVDAFLAPSVFTLRRHLADGLEVPFVHLPLCVADAPEESWPLAGQGELRLPAAPFFLYVGRLEKLKGLHTVIPLFREYQKAHLVVAGDGDYSETLKRLARGCDRIHFLGHLTPSRLRGVYARALALLVPSITFETFGQVIIEAHAARTPVIARDLGPFPEILAESGGGLLFRDDTELLEAMERLRADRVFRDRLGEAGYQAYRARWTEEVYLQRYLGLIEKLRERKGLTIVAHEQSSPR